MHAQLGATRIYYIDPHLFSFTRAWNGHALQNDLNT